MTAKAMTVAGVMSGTSADGIDVALVRISPGKDHRPPMRKKRAWMGHSPAWMGHSGIDRPKLTLLAHEAFPYPAALRRAVLGGDECGADVDGGAGAAELAAGDGVCAGGAGNGGKAPREGGSDRMPRADALSPGQAARYAGRAFKCTWQAGEPAMVAAEMGVPVVSNFRPADMAAGGQGAPLAPLLDYVLFADGERGRVLQNIGGIANLTAIPAGAGPEAVVAFDTGPGNMVMDWLAGELLGKRFDRDGREAARGAVIAEVLAKESRNAYYRLAPPKSAGREEFGAEYAARFLKECRRFSARAEDALATAAALTAETIARSYARFVAAGMEGRAADYIVSGGGARNGALMGMLRERLEPLGCRLREIGDFGIPAEAKEAAAFALLAWMTWNRRPGNMPAATGATRAVVLGSVTHV